MNKVSIYKVQLIRESSVDFDNLVIKSPDDAADVARKFYEFSYGGTMPDREVSVGIWLTSKNVVCGIEVISIGSLNAAIVHPREVFVGAITHKAASIIFCHIGMKNQWRNYKLLYPRCYINFAVFLMAKASLKVG